MSAPDLLRLLAERDVHLTVSVDGRLEIDAPADALEAEELAFLREHRAEIIDGLLADPAAHCPACGSPSWWRAPGAGWRCSYCEPRPQPLPAGAECVTLFSGQWAPGCAPPAAIPVTVDGLLAIHGETVAGCRTLDVLEQADDTDLPDFLADRAALEGFAAALVADRRIRPLPDASLPPLHRLAQEIGDEPGELRAWLDRTGPGRALRVRLEREHGACDRCLLALRADPDGPLLLALARALDGASHTPSSTRGADR